jgi:3-oxoisoapionate kinase
VIGAIESESKGFAAPRAVERAILISGSCSPVTARQIAWALEHGAAEVPLDTAALQNSRNLAADVDAVAQTAAAHFDQCRSVVIHTSRGPDDPRIAASKQTPQSGLNRERLGVILGRLLKRILELRQVERVAVAGGDTSGDIARTIGIDALEMLAPLAPGAPLCIAHSEHAAVDGVEFTFKGGQVGHDDFFGTLVRGVSR